MGILIRKQKGAFMFTGIARLAITGFIVALSASFIDTIWSVYMDSFVNSVVIVGFISAFLTIVSFFSFFILSPVIEKTHKSRLYLITLIAFAIGYLLFVINTKFYIFLLIAFVLTILTTLKITSFGIIVKDKSKEKHLSRNEGLMYTFFNLAWVIGPLIAGYISKSFGINLIFTLSAIFLLVAAAFFQISGIKDAHINKKPKKNILKNFREFFKDKNEVYSYFVSGGVSLWWILIYLYMPLYIIRNGLDTLWIGYFLFGAAVPLILLEFYFSKLAGKIGFKKIFKIGFFILSFFSVLCFIISNFQSVFGINSIYIILVLLSLASVGAAMVEPTTEAYFFDITKDKDEPRFYGPYNTTIDVNQFLGKMIASVMLLFLPFHYIFLLFAIFMAAFMTISFKIKDVIERKK